MSTPFRDGAAQDDGDGLSLVVLVQLLTRHRRALLAGLLLGAALGVLVPTLRGPRYTASASFTPQTSGDQSRAALAGLAGSFGVNLSGLGGSPPSPQFYAELIKTRDVLGPVLDEPLRLASPGRPRTLGDYLEGGTGSPPLRRDRQLRELRDDLIATEVSTRTGIVAVSVTTRWPDVSFGVLQRLIEEVNRYNLRSRQSQGAAERRFTEGRLAEAQRDLSAAEDRQEQFLSSNRTFEGAPALRLEYERLGREVGLRQQVVASLAQAYEEARIREVRDTPVISLVESPTLPVRPDGRRRVLFAGLGGVLGASAALLVALARATLGRARDAARWPAFAGPVGETTLSVLEPR